MMTKVEFAAEVENFSDSIDHRHRCAGYSEGLACCLDDSVIDFLYDLYLKAREREFSDAGGV